MGSDAARVFEFSGVQIVGVVDGDTVDALIPVRVDNDFGFGVLAVTVHHKQRLRLYGVNCPESNRPASRVAGLAAKQFTMDRLLGKTVRLRSHKAGHEKYGRYLAEVFLDGVSFSQTLLDAGHAVRFLDDDPEP